MLIRIDEIAQDIARDDTLEELAEIEDTAEFAAALRGTLSGAVLAGMLRFEFSSVKAVVDEVMANAALAASAVADEAEMAEGDDVNVV